MRGTLVIMTFCGLLFAGIIILTAGCVWIDEPKVSLKVIAAGSLLEPLQEAATGFERTHPGTSIDIEGHGSIQVIRQVTDLHRKADLLAVADASLIPDLMYQPRGDGSGNYTNWFLPFARNDMVVAYTADSMYAREITQDNWYTILARPDVRVGISNPMLDASGYRAIMVVQLAESTYHNESLFEMILGNSMESTPNQSVSGNITTITLPAIIRSNSRHLAMRDGSIYLLSLLESGGIDYAFEYRSVTEAHNLHFINLPASINLGDPSYADTYRNVVVILGFPRFNSIGQERTGAPIVYAMTIPAGEENPALAREFMEYMNTSSQEGRRGWPAPFYTRSRE